MPELRDTISDIAADMSNETPVWTTGDFAHALIEAFEAKGLAIVRADEAERALADVVASLREDAQRCDCFARSEGECACGAWYTEPGERSYKKAYIEDIADAIERGEHTKDKTP